MVFLLGDVRDMIFNLAKDVGAQAYTGIDATSRGVLIWIRKSKQDCRKGALRQRVFNGALLFEPTHTLKDDGTPYKVFTPFYKKGCLGRNEEPRDPLLTSEGFDVFDYAGVSLDDLG